LWRFAFFSGLRSSELIALHWEDIDWDKKTANINKAFVCGEFKTTKTPSGVRKLLLLPPALKALKLQKQYTFSLKGQVFYNPYTNQPWTDARQIRERAWCPIIKAAGVRYRNPYQTRHTYASMMLSKGENILWVAQQMGHVNIEMVIEHYAKWIPDNDITEGYKPISS